MPRRKPAISTQLRTALGLSLGRIARNTPWRQARLSASAQNVWLLYTEVIWWGLLEGVAATYLTVLAVRLGASPGQLGWLSALPALINVFWLLPAARIIERQRRRLPLVLATGALQRLGYLLIALVPMILIAGQVEALIVLTGLITIPTAIIHTSISSLIPDLVEPGLRAHVISRRYMLLSGTSTAVALVGGRFLDLVPAPLNYQILFAAAALISLLGLRSVRRLQVPDAVVAARSRPRPSFPGVQLWNSLSSVRQHPEFVRFALGSFLYHWGVYLPSAVYSLYRVRDLGATDGWIGTIMMVTNITTLLTYTLWGRVAARWGNQRALLASTAGLVAYPVLTAAVSSVPGLLLPAVAGGLFVSGYSVSTFNAMLSVCPAAKRATYIALYTTLINVTAFLAPLGGSALAGWLGARTALYLAGAGRLLGWISLLWLVRGATGRPRRRLAAGSPTPGRR